MSQERLIVIYMYLYFILMKALLIFALVWLTAFCFGKVQFFQAWQLSVKSNFEKLLYPEQYV